MGQNRRCSWDDAKATKNLEMHGYAFSDLDEIFDGRFILTRIDDRRDYGEIRYNALVELRARIINVTFTPRNGRIHLISVRPASREERMVYHAKNPSR